MFKVLAAIQIAILGGLLYLSRLATTHGGVNHHVYYMKNVYTAENGLASTSNAIAILIAMALLTAVTLLSTVSKRKRRSLELSPLFVFSISVLTLTAGVFVFVALSAYGQSLLIYPYLLAGLLAVWLLAGLQVAVTARIHLIERDKL